MSKMMKFNSQSLSEEYSPASDDEIPFEYTLNLIEYKREEVEKYSVGLWHIFLKKHFGPPLECEGFLCKSEEMGITNTNIQGTKEFVSFRRKSDDPTKLSFLDISEESLKKYNSGELTLDVGFINWKYFVKLLSGTIIVIETQNHHSTLRFGLINCQEDAAIREAKRFISYLLDKIQKDAKNLVNPKKLLKENKAPIYCLWNGYLSNYHSGKEMINIAEEQESRLKKETLKEDTYSILTEFESLKNTEESILCCGMFYSSAISYFFMAFEGFLNLVYHAFTKYQLKDIEIEKRFDIKQKIQLMPSLCFGFQSDKICLPSDLENDFDNLKNYRNELFHSKSADNRLKSIISLHDGFFYTHHVDDFEDFFLPLHKIRLSIDDVYKVKSIVDSMVNNIKENMEDNVRELTEMYILKRSVIPFVVQKNGIKVMGDSEINF